MELTRENKKSTRSFLVKIKHKEHIDEVVFSASNAMAATEKAEKRFPAHSVISSTLIKIYS
jgi:hypothetical protein